MGRLLAWRLLLTGRNVQLLEQSSFDQPISAAYTAAAMISPMSEVVVSERAIYDMGLVSLELWPQWLEQLRLAQAPPIAYLANGSLVVAHPSDEAELEQFYQDLNFHLGEQNRAQWLNQQNLRQREPDIAEQFQRALFLPDEAYLDNRALLNNLLETIRSLGGICIDKATVNFAPELHCDHPQVDFSESDLIIDCRGTGAHEFNRDIRGVRGEVLWVQTEEIQLHHPVRLMHPRYKLYIVPKPDHHFIIGATEIESQDRSPVSVQSMLELCSALYTVNPAFAEARIVELDANLRPSLWDNLPLISEHQIHYGELNKRVLAINGLYRHGYLLAPCLVNQTLVHHIENA